MGLKAIKASGRGNVTYYYGTTATKAMYALLRGGGTKETDVKSYMRQRGYFWQERSGFRRVMAWRKDGLALAEFATDLAYLKHLGFDIIPAKNLNSVKHIPIGEWNSKTRTLSPPVNIPAMPTAMFKMLCLFRGQKIAMASVKQWIAENGYVDVETAVNETMRVGEFSATADGLFICSFGTPTRRLFLGWAGSVLSSIRQWNGQTWGQLTACRLYGHS